MTLAQKLHRPTQVERIQALEERADKHDAIAGQVNEMYEVFDLTRKIARALNRASVKVAAGGVGLLGALAALLTVIDKARQLFGH